jgi:hypothetical protein
MWRILGERWGQGLSPAALGVAAAIVAGEVAWSPADALEPAGLAELEAWRSPGGATAVVEMWDLERGRQMTFTPYGAARFGLMIWERPVSEQPYWAHRARADAEPSAIAFPERGSVPLNRPELLPAPASGADAEAVQEYIADPYTGETTRDPARAWKLFCGRADLKIDVRLARARAKAARRRRTPCGAGR